MHKNILKRIHKFAMQMDHVDGTMHAWCMHKEKNEFTPKSFIYIKYSLIPKGMLFPDFSFLFLFLVLFLNKL